MTSPNYFEEALQEVYSQGKMSEEDINKFANAYNAGISSKKVPERMESVVVKTAMLKDIQDLLDENLQREIDRLVNDVQSYPFVDWRSQEVDYNGMEEHFFNQASLGRDATEEGAAILEEVDETYNSIINVWNNAVDYIEEEIEGGDNLGIETERPYDDDSDDGRGSDPDSFSGLGGDDDSDDEWGSDSDDTFKPEPTETSDDKDDLIDVYAPTGIIGDIGAWLTREKTLRGPYDEEGDE